MVAAAKTEKKSYKDLITIAISTLKERTGSSRQAIKKYIQANFPSTNANFDSQFNLAIKKGVTSGIFVQPKGPSGPVKLNKEKLEKPKAKKVAKKAAPKKAAPKKVATKKAAPKKATTTKKTTTKAPKKATTTKKVTKKAAPKKTTKAPKKAAPKKK